MSRSIASPMAGFNLERWRRLLAIMLVAGAALGLQAAARADAPRHGGTLTMLVYPEPPTLTTIAHSAGASVMVSAKTTEGLLSYDFDLTPRPQLATAWEISDDGLTYTFTLRPDVRWHDGMPFTSADAAHSIELLKVHHPRGRATFASVAEIETPDELTLVLRLSQPVPYLIKAFAASESPIVPKHLYADVPANANPHNNAPVGTGPFVFKQWVRGSHIIYERNPDYWDPPKPYVDRLVVRFIADAGARAAAIESGEVLLSPSTPVPLSDLERLQQDPRLAFETEGYQYVNNVSRLEFNLESPILRNLGVRRAIAHALDREALLNTVWYGHGELIEGPIVPALPGYADKLEVPSYDLDAARQRLAEAGYPDGKLADGSSITLTIVPIPNEGGIRTAHFLQQSLARLGIAANISTQDFASYVPRIYTQRDFDIHVSVMSNTFDPSVGVQRLYWSQSFQRGLPFSNGSGYANPEADELLERAAVERDERARIEALHDFQRHIARDLPDITLLALETHTIAHKRVRDHTLGANGVADNLAEVWLDAP